MFTQLTADNLQDIIAANQKVLVQFGGTIEPFLEELAANTESVKFIYADVRKYPRSKRLALVQSTPTFATFKNGKIVAQVAKPRDETVKRLLAEIG